MSLQSLRPNRLCSRKPDSTCSTPPEGSPHQQEEASEPDSPKPPLLVEVGVDVEYGGGPCDHGPGVQR